MEKKTLNLEIVELKETSAYETYGNIGLCPCPCGEMTYNESADDTNGGMSCVVQGIVGALLGDMTDAGSAADATCSNSGNDCSGTIGSGEGSDSGVSDGSGPSGGISGDGGDSYGGY